jgi:hypothetical protein
MPNKLLGPRNTLLVDMAMVEGVAIMSSHILALLDHVPYPYFLLKGL